MHLFFGMPSQKNFVSRPFILLLQFNLALLLRFLVYLHLNFTLSLNLIYSINHFLLSLFHALTSLLWLFDLASGLSSHCHFRSIVHNHFIHLLYGLLMYTVSGNKPPSNYYGWLMQAL